MRRMVTLFKKEALDLARNRAALLPVAFVAMMTLILPFVIVVVVPAVTGHRLGDDSDLVRVSMAVGMHERLSADGRVQLFLFQQFLILFLLIPITGAMAIAAHAVVGEKQARTLEPLLATPITTAELLLAKVLGAFVPTLSISIVGLTLYVGIIAAFAEPGVMRAMVSARTFVLIGLVGPAAALVSLQSAIVISSRVNDPRTAQQFGALIIIPLSAILVAQFAGSLWLSLPAMALLGLGLFTLWVLLTLVSVAIFEREAILTKWR